jgi:signal peptidase I
MNEEKEIASENEADSPFQSQKKFLSGIADYVEIFVVAICVVILCFSFLFRLCKVNGPSMEKTLYHNEMLLVSDLLYEPKRGDIIVFHDTGYYNEAIVKRIIAVGGDTINIDFATWTVTVTDKNGNTFVVDEDYAFFDENRHNQMSTQHYPCEIPEGKLFVMGDNRYNSSDSRFDAIGLVDEREVLGRLVCRLSPLDKFGKV